MARSFFGLVVVAALAALQVKAEPRSNVTCVDQKWSFNSLQQSPCLVSAYLSAQCTSDNDWIVPEIGAEGPYSPPKEEYANTCRCNSVQWNLLSACSLCQGGPSGSWTDWIGNCSSSVVNVGRYPLPIPSGTTIPHWAYYDFTGMNIFNAVTASQQTGPESSPPAVASSTPAYSSVVGTPSIPTATPLPAGSKSNSSGNNTGAIVGGVVGGVLGLAVLVFIAVVLVRKSKQSPPKNESQNQNGYNYPAPVPAQPNSASPMMGQYQPGMPHPGLATPGPEKPYDPSDPTTFPTPQSYAPSQYPQSLSYSQHPSQYQPGQYHGAPEV